jgi:hypothetical protein
VRILINVRRSTRRRLTHLASWFMLSRRRSDSQAFRRQHKILSPLVRVHIILQSVVRLPNRAVPISLVVQSMRRWLALP